MKCVRNSSNKNPIPFDPAIHFAWEPLGFSAWIRYGPPAGDECAPPFKLGVSDGLSKTAEKMGSSAEGATRKSRKRQRATKKKEKVIEMQQVEGKKRK